MIGKIDKTQIPENLMNPASRQNRSADSLENNCYDASVRIDYAALLKRATEIPKTDANNIEKALQLLSSGELDSIDNCRKAAENLLEFGI